MKTKKQDLALKRAFDTLIMTTRSNVEFDPIEREEAISNTKWFLLEENHNYDVTDSLAEGEIGLFVDPSQSPSKACTVEYVRWFTLRFIVQSLVFRIITFTLIIIDLSLILVDLILDCPPGKASRVLNFVDFALSCIFMLELFLRIFALRPKIFFKRKHWFNILDFGIVFLTLIISIAYTITIEQSIADGIFQDGSCEPIKKLTILSISKILVIFRMIRFLRLLRLLRVYTEHHQIKRAIRQKVSQNKRRYQQDGVDLDLTYVTRNIIAMSFPSTGLMSWYRNPIREVKAFLDQHHGDCYQVYNLCSERTYEDHWFHNRVTHWPVDDHNVPSVVEMVEFVDQVMNWLSSNEKSVVAIHCKGGKGRTGTMICILLIEFELFQNAAQSLEFFGQRRTDRNVSSQFQGVETASQIRYVTYFEKLRKLPQKFPQDVWMKIEQIRITGISSVGKGNGSDLSLKVSSRHQDELFVDDAISNSQMWNYNPKDDCLTIQVSDQCPEVVHDIRLKFYSSSSRCPKGYENCAFYFWFHTFFVEVEGQIPPRHNVPQTVEQLQRRQLVLRREEIDNPHKEKTWHVFKENFQIEVLLRVKPNAP